MSDTEPRGKEWADGFISGLIAATALKLGFHDIWDRETAAYMRAREQKRETDG